MEKALLQIIYQYENISLQNGQTIRCPYWSNLIKNGKFGGKGSSVQIQQALNQALSLEKILSPIPVPKIESLARRHHIGIDCSGYIMRILGYLSQKKLISKSKLESLFPKGIYATNADMLTANNISFLVKKVTGIHPLDLVRMMDGKHILMVIENSGKEIIYTHSSGVTQIRGVHKGKIIISNPQKGLEDQLWNEKTRLGFNFGKKYYHPQKGDGIKRINFIQNE